MAIAPTRIAAFEFLIQFRSLGRGQIRSAARQLGSLRRNSQQVQRVVSRGSAVAQAYGSALSEIGFSARRAAASEDGLRRSIARTNRQIQLRRAAEFRGRVRSAATSRSGQLASRLLGSNAAGSLALFRAQARTAASSVARLTRSLSPLGAGLKLISGLVRGVIGALASWAKFNALAVGATALLAVGLAKLSDSWTTLTNRIRVSSDGTETVTETSNKLLSVALRSRTPLKNVAELYGRLSINAKQFGLSQGEVLGLVEVTSKAIKIAGSTSREAEQATLQFAQALGSNRLSGDELRSVREQAPELAQTLARGLGIGVGALKEYGEAGRLTTAVVAKALLSQQKIVDARFGRVEATFTDGAINIGSALRFFSSSVLTSLKLGPKFFNFADKIALSFQKISKNSGFIGEALRNIPSLLRDLNLRSFSRLADLLANITQFFEELPQKILDVSRKINLFSALRSQGFSVEDAVQSSFGISPEQLRSNLSGVNSLFGGFLTQLTAFGSALSNLTSAINSIARGFDNISRIISTITPFQNSGERRARRIIERTVESVAKENEIRPFSSRLGT